MDPSQPMLNMLVRKYPNVAAVYPMTIEQALAAVFTPGQFEIVTAYDSADEISPETISALASLASRALVIRGASDVVEVVDMRGSRNDTG